VNKTVLVIAAGFLALTGAALAAQDQSAVVGGNLKTPAGEYPVDMQQTGLPKAPDVAFGDTVDQVNAAFDDNSVPLEVQRNEDGARINVRCTPDMPDGSCITDEPTAPYPKTGILDVGPDGVVIANWIHAGSGEVFRYVPDDVKNQLPPEQQQAIEDANEQVGATVDAQMVDGTGAPSDPGFRLRTPLGTVGGDAKLSDLLSGVGAAGNKLGEGTQPVLGAGSDDWLSGDAPGLQQPVKGGSNGVPGDSAQSNGSSDAGVSTMAIAAALVGVPTIGGLALYHRIRSNNTLNNKTRQAVYDSVVRSPGIGVNDAAKAAGCSYSTAAYHLERLVEERLLVASEDGRRARFFKNGGAFSQAEREFVPILQSDECMDVLQTIVENPWCYRAEVAQKLSVSGPTVNWHLKKLMGAGVVKEMREGRISYLYADKKLLTNLGANLIGKLPDDLVGKLRFEAKPAPELVEPALSLPETTVPEYGIDEVELAPLPESS
jgi:predicted transcriptional regulator